MDHEEYIPTNEERYAPYIKRATNGDDESAAYLLWRASTYIEAGDIIPEPLASYMATTLHNTAHVAKNLGLEPDSKKRAVKIVQTLNLQRRRSKRKNTKHEIQRKESNKEVILYMYRRIRYDGTTKYQAAKEASENFPNAVVSSHSKTNDSRIKAYISTYNRVTDEEKEFMFFVREITNFI